MTNYKVYLIRDRQDVVRYVGATTQNLNTRFTQHCFKRKLDRAQFKIEIVRDDLSKQEALLLESMLIKQHATQEKGWNVSGYGAHPTDEMKLRWRKERPGRTVSEAHAAKNRVARLGAKNSGEHNEKISAGVSRPVICLETGEVFGSARKAAVQLKLNYSKISLVCNGKRSMTGGLHFKFYEKR